MSATPTASETWFETETKFDHPGAEADFDPRVLGLTVLWHDDPDRVGERVALAGLDSDAGAPVARHEPLFAQPGASAARPLASPHLSRRPLRVLRSDEDGGVVLDATATRTPVAADGRPVDGVLRLDSDAVERGVVLLLGRRVVLLLHRFDPAAEEADDDLGLVGASDAVVALRRALRQVADLDLPVLLRGESGTGKELAARALHRLGRRVDGPFVAVNMAAVPASLAAAELFGARRGAFTGADAERRGFFRRADGGTLFLDEVGDTPAEVQPLLLRALESGEIQPLGASRAERVDVRLVAATDADLEDAVSAGRFRAPLLHRLAPYTVQLPPLRRRRDDFGRLLLVFLRRELAALGEDGPRPVPHDQRPWLDAARVAELARLPWPGNVRQLRNAAQRLVVRGRGRRGLDDDVFDQLVAEQAPSESVEQVAEEPVERPSAPPPGRRRRFRKPSEVDDAEVVEAMRAAHWRIGAAAERLGVSRTSLYDLIERVPGLHTAGDLGRAQIERALARQAGDVRAAARALEVSTQALRRRLSALGLGD